MSAIQFVVASLLGLYQVVLLLRLLMQWVRADFRNPVSRAIVQLTDPVILPLRKILPPIRRIDTASVVAILAVTVVKILVGQLLLVSSLPRPICCCAICCWRRCISCSPPIYLPSFSMPYCPLLPGELLPAQSLLNSICEPVLRPIRRVIPSVAGLDLSPLWACIAIQALLILVR